VLAQLSREHRETFLLYHVQGLSVREVAAVLDVPAGTVKSRLFMARQRLRELLQPPEPVSDQREGEGTRAGSCRGEAKGKGLQ
jgi:DNA-directed RNA polymerase specialized sigma24 family protein